jgi:DNA repair protein RadA/Sms
MSLKKRTVFVCQNCSLQSFKWLGKCPDCNEFNSFVEEIIEEKKASGVNREFPTETTAVKLSQISYKKELRLKTGITELDRTLGGGVVAGAAMLIGGDPGIGKSTLLLQMTSSIKGDGGAPILYVSGEESALQIRLRSERLNVNRDNLFILTETSLENIIKEIKRISPLIIIIDSIQTIYTLDLGSTAGTVSQIRECASRLIYVSKVTGIPVMFVGHITKGGDIAGPKVLEHMVDTVLYFEGDRGHPYRILRSVKNRFGSTNEIGVFEMTEGGLVDVKNPSELFLSQRPIDTPGSVVISSLEGTRPLLIELQALVTQSNLGMPRRTTIGVDHSRVALLVAILEKKLGMHLMAQDIFLNAAGGVKVDEPAVDLGIVACIASSFLNKPVEPCTVIIGEVGLTGEVRVIRSMDERINEAAKMGFTKCIIPKHTKIKSNVSKKIKILPVETIKDMFELLFS